MLRTLMARRRAFANSIWKRACAPSLREMQCWNSKNYDNPVWGHWNFHNDNQVVQVNSLILNVIGTTWIRKKNAGQNWSVQARRYNSHLQGQASHGVPMHFRRKVKLSDAVEVWLSATMSLSDSVGRRVALPASDSETLPAAMGSRVWLRLCAGRWT